MIGVAFILIFTLCIRIPYWTDNSGRGCFIAVVQNGAFLGCSVGLFIHALINGDVVDAIFNGAFSALFVYYVYYYYTKWKKSK